MRAPTLGRLLDLAHAEHLTFKQLLKLWSADSDVTKQLIATQAQYPEYLR